jgi:hypothetical protein
MNVKICAGRVDNTERDERVWMDVTSTYVLLDAASLDRRRAQPRSFFARAASVERCVPFLEMQPRDRSVINRTDSHQLKSSGAHLVLPHFLIMFLPLASPSMSLEPPNIWQHIPVIFSVCSLLIVDSPRLGTSQWHQNENFQEP